MSGLTRFNPMFQTWKPMTLSFMTHSYPFYKGHFTEAGWICYKDLRSALRWAASFRLTFQHISVNPPQIPSWPSTRPTSLRTRSQNHIESLHITTYHYNGLTSNLDTTIISKHSQTNLAKRIAVNRSSLCVVETATGILEWCRCAQKKEHERNACRHWKLSGLNESSWVKLLSLWK